MTIIRVSNDLHREHPRGEKNFASNVGSRGRNSGPEFPAQPDPAKQLVQASNVVITLPKNNLSMRHSEMPLR
jgi:hypothetical protein